MVHLVSRAVAIVAVLLTLGGEMVPFPTLADEAGIAAKPIGIDDGDTFVIQFRSQGIDTPEKKQLCENAAGACYACGQDAKKALLDMIRTGLEGSIREIPA